MSKVTETTVMEIRKRYAVGDVFQKDLAAEFGLCQQQISNIVRQARWGRV